MALPQCKIDNNHVKWIYVCLMCFILCEHLSLVESFNWTQLPLNPFEVVAGSTVSLTWSYYREENDILYIETSRKIDDTTSAIGHIDKGGKVNMFSPYGVYMNLTKVNQSATLNIIEIKKADEAEYCCKVATSKQIYETCILLNVLVAPKIDVYTMNKTVNETQSLDLFCNATGIPAPNISWTKVGSDKQLSQKEHLVIDPVRKEDSGIYMCKASNKARNTAAQIFVSVQYKPRNTTLLSSAVMDAVTANESVTFNCSTDANPPAHLFNLYHEGSFIAQNATFTIERITWSNRGKYTCAPSNIFGKGQIASITLTVFVPPQLVISPGDQTVNESDTLLVLCNASGNPAPHITWTKMGMTGPPTATGNRMKIANVSHEKHDGIYECTASNGIGKNATVLFKVTVNYKAIMTRLQSNLTNNELVTGSALMLSCMADALPSPDFYRFSQNGNALRNTRGVLTIDKAIISHEGVYECTPHNILGAGQAAVLNITVLVPPQIVTKPQNTTVNETDALLLFCNATGRPPPIISWSKDGLPLGASSDSQTLKLENTTKQDAGVYTCSATSRVTKSDTAKAFVSVNYRPTITLWSQTAGSWINQTTELFCQVEGIPTPNVSWSRSGAKSLATVNHTHVISKFTIIPRKPRDFGVYTCEAVNILGTQKQSMNLVQFKPPAKPVISVESGINDIQVHWTPPADGGQPITNYTVQVKKIEGGKWRDCKDIKQKDNKMSCSFTDVESGTKYVVRVIAVNKIGRSEPTTKEITTKPDDSTSTHARIAGFPPWIYWIIGAGSLVIVIVIVTVAVVCIVKKRRSTRTEEYNLEKIRKKPTPYSLAYGNSAQDEETEEDQVEDQGEVKQPTKV